MMTGSQMLFECQLMAMLNQIEGFTTDYITMDDYIFPIVANFEGKDFAG